MVTQEGFQNGFMSGLYKGFGLGSGVFGLSVQVLQG